MPASQSFVDLRTSSLSAGSHTDDSVWPSFTDIMTVVVMIFLMSLVVILLKNVELVKSEQEAARIAELKGSENIELEAAVNQLEQRIAQVQLQLQAQTLKTAQSQEQLGQSQQEVQSMLVDIQALQLLRDKLNQENTNLATAKLALEGRLKIVEQEKANVESLKEDAIKTNLLIEDEKQQLIIQLNAAFGENQKLASTLTQQDADIEALENAKQTVILQVQEAETENQKLASTLTQREADIEALEKAKQTVIVQVQDAEAEKSRLLEQSEESQQDFDALQAVYSLLKKDNRSLSDRISDAEKMIAELEANLKTADQTIEVKQQQLEVAETEIETKTTALANTSKALSQTSVALTQTSQELTETTQVLSQAQEEFTQLEQKYLELVGPARSELNKYVVRVRYKRSGNQKIIQFARPEDESMVQLSLPQLHQRLAELKKQKSDDLYVRVVIPLDSGLSYDDAWRFTQDILNKYDYYYQ